MTNPLDSFNPEKAKCLRCQEYFDKSDMTLLKSLVAVPPEYICQECYGIVFKSLMGIEPKDR